MSALCMVVSLPFGKHLIRLLFAYRRDSLQRQVLGLHFPNPLGIAAGFDKHGTYVRALAALGFGHIEIGSVTPRPQAGNPKPRLFRLVKSNALINRMGFNNAGADVIARRLANYANRNFILGANIGKNKDTPNEEALNDYLYCFNLLHPYVDYFVINVSSPNTPGLRELQDREPLKRILEAILERNSTLTEPRPVLLKIAPDLNEGQVQDIIELVIELKLPGLVVNNTTISRDGLSDDPGVISAAGNGGLSGAPLRQRSQELLSYLRKHLPDEVVLIGVGGIASGEDARERIEAGASLVQLYTGFVYEGPGLIRDILKRLSRANVRE